MNKIEIVQYILKQLFLNDEKLCVLSVDSDGFIIYDTDIDIITFVSSTKQIIKKILKLIEKTEWTLVNFYWHGGGGVQLFLSNSNEGIILDLYDRYWSNKKLKIYFNKDFVIKKFSFYYLPSAACELTYVLLKRFSKNLFESNHYDRIFRLIRIVNIDDPYLHMIEKKIGYQNFNILIENLKNNLKFSNEFIHENYLKINRTFFDKVVSFTQDIPRIWFRIIHPTGFSLLFLGPDGSGKTTIIKKTIIKHEWLFRKVKNIHFRPSLLEKKKYDIITEPHLQNSRGILISYLKLFYYFFDYVLGNIFIFYPTRWPSGLIIFERYFYDIIVDPIRYRYGGNKQFTELLSKFVPKPNLTFILIGDPKILYMRKKELSLQELERQIVGYKKLSKEISNSFIINTLNEIDDVVRFTSLQIKKQLSLSALKNISKYIGNV